MTEPAAKRFKTKSVSSPRSIVTWNCNGFITRCTKDSTDLKRLLAETNEPDCICLQEVRLKATNQQRGKPLASEYEVVKPALTAVFGDKYDTFWSLADSRYAGTLTLLHKRLNFAATGGEARTAFTPQAAIDVLCKMYGVTREQVGLPKASKVKEVIKKKGTQKSMTSFFASKKTPASTSTSPSSQEHNSDGRFQFFFFPDMHLIQTYVPNNGMKDESFERRRIWDADMLCFFRQRQTILEHVTAANNSSILSNNPRLLWCGDMNCARDHRDGTHWEKKQGETNGRYEWWTDEAKCISGKKPDFKRSSNDIGMPSFTPSERKRFEEIIKEAKLVDIWRKLHPNGSERHDQSQWDRPDWTWRGHLSTNGFSKYEGKGQRLDYFLVTGSTDDVESCEILGYGRKREGLFCGSDHCASLLVFKEKGRELMTKESEVTAKDV